jgi:hypothetical protein
MDTIQDFEDMLGVLAKHRVRYLIVGGLAYIHHGKPPYTKDMGVWVDPSPKNIQRANAALAEFGSPLFLDPRALTEITQLGMPPNRIDFLLSIEGEKFDAAWKKRIKGSYGRAPANWIDIDTLIRIKSRIADPRHQDDARVLREVKKLRAKRGR